MHPQPANHLDLVKTFDVVVVGARIAGRATAPPPTPHGAPRAPTRGRPFTLPARFVVGPDRFRSTIARLVQAPLEHVGQHASAITYGYWTGAHVDGYEWIFRPDAAAGAIPTNDGQVCVFASATPERIGRGGTGVIESILRSSAPDL